MNILNKGATNAAMCILGARNFQLGEKWNI